MINNRNQYHASKNSNEISPYFVEKKSFEKAFPMVKDVRLIIEESGDGIKDRVKKTIYGKQDLPGEFIECRNPLCNKGGFFLGRILRKMVKSHLTDFTEPLISCKGYVSPDRRIKHGDPCLNSFSVEIHIEFKENSG